MCTCVYIRIHVHTGIRKYTYDNRSVRVCVYIGIHVYIGIYVYGCTCMVSASFEKCFGSVSRVQHVLTIDQACLARVLAKCYEINTATTKPR